MASLPTAPLITRAAINAVRARIADPIIGFNPQYAQTVHDTNYQALGDLSIDTGIASLNFYIGKVKDIVKAISTSNLQFPLFNIYSINAVNKPLGHEKGHIFDGMVTIGMDVHLEWDENAIQDDFDISSDIINSVLFTIFNYSGYMSLWPSGVYWTQNFTLTNKSGAVLDGSNWYESLTYTMQFRLIQG